MAGNQIQITDAGRAALVASGNTGTVARRVVEIGLGTAAFTFDNGMKTLPNERKRVTTFGGENVAPDTVHVVIQDDSDDQYSLYAYGLYLDNGVLFGVFVQSTPILEKSPAAMLLLASDVVFATIDAALLQFGPATFLNPPATTERKGVVELATQAEVDAGDDDTRAVTPKTARKRYARLIGDTFTGPIVTEFDAGDKSAHLTVRPPSGARGRESRIRLFGTFSGTTPDVGTRLVTTIRAGFDAGAWGSEYLDVWLNKGANDEATDALQQRVVRLKSGGRVLFGATDDDGTSTIQSAGDVRAQGAITGGRGKTRAIVNSDDYTAYFYSSGDGQTFVGGNGKGWTSIITAGLERMRVTNSGRVLIGKIDDDEQNALQVKGSVAASSGVKSTGYDTGGANWRATGPNYGVMLRNDDNRAWFLSTAKGDPNGGFGPLRPFSWALDTGKVTIDGTGVGAEFGGAVYVAGDLSVGRSAAEAHLQLGPSEGYLYGSAQSIGFWSPTKGAFQYLFADRTFRIDGKLTWHEGNLDPLDKTKGGTLGGDLAFAAGKCLILAEGSLANPSLTFANDGAPDTGLYHSGDGLFGVTCNGASVLRFTPALAAFDQVVTGPTPPPGDRSTRLATTEWVLAVVSTTTIGQIVFEPRTTVRAGFLKANGVLVNRADYPGLWAYAQASGALVSDADWQNGHWGCFSMGDGATTFRLPEMRGQFIRCWADGRNDIDPQRGIGSFQADQNRWHAHGASASEVGDHAHSAWTDGQGQHNHPVNDPGHAHSVRMGRVGIVATSYGQGWGPYNWDRQDMHGTEGAGTGIWLSDAGNHGHNVGIGGAGRHSHGITVNGDGGNESRPRNVALLAMIRAY